MVCDALVLCEEVKLGLDPVVFLVEEVDLILELCHSLLVQFLLVLHAKLLHVLAASVKAAQSQDFIVSDLD